MRATSLPLSLLLMACLTACGPRNVVQVPVPCPTQVPVTVPTSEVLQALKDLDDYVRSSSASTTQPGSAGPR